MRRTVYLRIPARISTHANMVKKRIIKISCCALKFVHSLKATKFCEIFTLLLSAVHTDKNKVQISQNFVAFSEYINFTIIMPKLNVRKWDRCVAL